MEDFLVQNEVWVVASAVLTHVELVHLILDDALLFMRKSANFIFFLLQLSLQPLVLFLLLLQQLLVLLLQLDCFLVVFLAHFRNLGSIFVFWIVLVLQAMLQLCQLPFQLQNFMILFFDNLFVLCQEDGFA